MLPKAAKSELRRVWRLSQALDSRIEDMLRGEERPVFIEHQKPSDIPMLVSQDKRCRLRIIGWLNTVEWAQVYWLEADAGGYLESEPHQAGSVENLSVVSGNLEITIGTETRTVASGETDGNPRELENRRLERPSDSSGISHIIAKIGAMVYS